MAHQSPFKMWFIRDGSLEHVVSGVGEEASRPRQDLEKAYWQNGYVDIVRNETITKKKSMTGKRLMKKSLRMTRRRLIGSLGRFLGESRLYRDRNYSKMIREGHILQRFMS